MVRQTGSKWLYKAALVRVTNLKLRLSRLRGKMLVFVGLVKKYLQHEFVSIGRRVTQVSKLPFAFAVNRFCSSRAKKKLDDGWPESIEEQGLLLFVMRHYITRQYIIGRREDQE